jgi:hypothetical protein
MDHQSTRGSDKLKAACTSVATLTPQQISQVAGGVSLTPIWWIRGTPHPFERLVDPGALTLPVDKLGMPGLR